VLKVVASGVMNLIRWLAFILVLSLAGGGLQACVAQAPVEVATQTAIPAASFPQQGAKTVPVQSPLSPTPSNTPSPTFTVTATATQLVEETLEVCSPLQDIALEALPGLVNNPFQPPAVGSDDPHQGVDLADRDASGLAVAGRTVQTVLSGEVAAVIKDRFPYGNAIMVETPLETLPAKWLQALELPPVTQPPEMHTKLTCPPLPEFNPSTKERSLYLLYAHMQDTTNRLSGEQVDCGQKLGSVGNSGNSINPHLHLETRLGPSAARFESLAHYDASASEVEMSNYCSWRVSGVFVLVDPMNVLTISP
jgi:murein DD-endopeptidase MepM/ murein hydrolase activator NlpD